MKESTVRNLKRLAKITGDKCSTCPTKEKHRCCDAYFCGLAKLEMQSLGVEIPEIEGGELPYMGPTGCIVPPEYRPGCSGFVCPPHLSDRSFRVEYEKLLEAVRADKDVKKAMKITTSLARAIFEENSTFIRTALELFPEK